MATVHSPSIENQVAGYLESMALNEEERARALDLLHQVSASIERHLTPKALYLLSTRGVTREQAIEYLAHRALEAVIEAGKKEAVS